MRITDVASTDLFCGTTARPLQIIKVTLVNDGPGMLRDLDAEVIVAIRGAGVATLEPTRMSRLVHGEERTVEIGVEIAAPAEPGATRQVTVVVQTPAGRSEATAEITVAEPGWTMWMVSHFHYDPVWWNTQGQFVQTWPLIAADDGSMPEVRTAFELVKLHLSEARSDPDYKFVVAEIDYLKPYFDAYPQDRADLLAFIKDGRIEVVGGSYNEPNTNLTSAESTIRNAVYGLAYQRDVLGAAPTTSWMLDAFGFDPGYPGLMAAAGLTESSWARGPFHQWGPGGADGGNQQMQFPSEFEWLSPDGTGLLTSYMPNHYSAGWITQHAADLATAERDAYTQFRQLAPVAATRNVLLPVGGDHVIPPRWATAIHRDWNARYVWPRFVTAVPSEFFEAVRSEGAASDTWFLPQTRDMNPVYPGKDVTYIDTKQAQRDAEIAVLDGERLATIAWLAGAAYPAASLDKAWRQLVFGAHHDAITGTEGEQVYLDLLAGWREAFERGDQARGAAMRYVARLADTAALTRAAAAEGAEAAGRSEAAARAEEAGTKERATRAPDLSVVTAASAPSAVRFWSAAPAVAVDPAGRPGAAATPLRSTPLVPLSVLVGSAGAAGSGPTGSARAVLVFNTLSFPRSGLARVALEFAERSASAVGLAEQSGAAVAVLAEGVTRHPDGSLATATLTFRAENVPPLGYLSFLVTSTQGAEVDRTEASGWSESDGAAIENALFTVRADSARGGALTSIVDRRAGTELLAGPGNELVLQQEYPTHPRWGEGPWLLCPTGESWTSADLASKVRAERCPIGARLVAEFDFDDLRVTQETLLWDGADRIEFRTHVDGSIGQDRLLRVRFAANVPGGLPVYQTGLSAIGRPSGPSDLDVAKHTYTLDNPANEWFAVSSTARVALTGPAGERRLHAIGVAEVIAPAGRRTDQFAPRDSLAGRAGQDCRQAVKDLMVALARQGVTATCSVPEGPRYGLSQLDSNLPDVRIALGGPEVNAFTASVLAAVAPAFGAELDRQLSACGTARIWIPAAKSRQEAFIAGADLRTPTDLPVLVVAGQDLNAAIAALTADLADAQAEVAWPEPTLDHEPDLAAHSVGLLNRGLPSSLVTPDGQACISLMRASSGWPCGIWQDGDKRTVPDGSSFAWQHWSHTFEYALAAGTGDWRTSGFAAAGQDYSHRLLACETDLHPGPLPAAVSLASVSPSGVDLMALKPRGNPLAPSDQPDRRAGVTIRLRDLTGEDGNDSATVHLFAGIAAAHVTSLLEQGSGERAECADSAATVDVPARGTVTLTVQPAAGSVDHDSHIDGHEVDGHVIDGHVIDGHVIEPQNAAGELPEPAQPVFTRYWLHGKGPAPAGNLPVAVHLSPGEIAAIAGELVTIALTVACGPTPASGAVSVQIPTGLRLVSVRSAAAAEAAPLAGDSLSYQLGANGFAAWDLLVQVPADATPARHFVTASINDDAGQVLEDAVVVVVCEKPPPPAGMPLTELAPILEFAAEAEADEARLTSLTGHVELAPGGRGHITVRLANNTASQIRGEAQLVCPHGSWAAVTPWTTGFAAAPGGAAELTFGVAIPADARPGEQWWALVKVMYFGRLRYSEPVWIHVVR